MASLNTDGPAVGGVLDLDYALGQLQHAVLPGTPARIPVRGRYELVKRPVLTAGDRVARTELVNQLVHPHNDLVGAYVDVIVQSDGNPVLAVVGWQLMSAERAAQLSVRHPQQVLPAPRPTPVDRAVDLRSTAVTAA